jgi:hypothetical protein
MKDSAFLSLSRLSLLCGLFVVYYYYSVSSLFSFYLFSSSSSSSFPFSCCPEVFKTLFVRPVNISNAHTSKKIEWGGNERRNLSSEEKKRCSDHPELGENDLLRNKKIKYNIMWNPVWVSECC